jgi:hypothetical protein
MKKRNLLLIIVCILIALISCSKKIDTTEHLYLCNALEENVTLNLFKGDTIFKYGIKPNDTIYLTTIHSGYVVGGGVNCHFPPATDRGEYLCSFDSAIVAYNSLIYTFTKNENLVLDSINTSVLFINQAYPINRNSIGDYSYYTYDEEYFEFLDREIANLSIANPDTIESDTIAPKDERHVPSVYLVNQLDMPIDLEMHHDSFPLSVQEELSWYRNAGVQNFTLQPNDTVYCDSIVYFTNDAERYFIFPGTNSYNGLVNSYFRIKINYNDNQYEYTDKADIQMLLRADSYWYIIFNEEKKNHFGWE